jgi:hypothetical protein
MSKKIKTISMIVMLFVLLLTACKPADNAENDPNAVYTQAAQTVIAQITQIAELTPSATATDIPLPTATALPTQVVVQPTLPPAPDQVIPTATVYVIPTAAPTIPVVQDKAAWYAQSPADGATISVDDYFTITWVLTNTGQTTWTTDYQYRYYSGAVLHQVAGYKLPHSVAPNETVELKVSAKAPHDPGEYLTSWVITNADGVNFYSFNVRVKTEAKPINYDELCCQPEHGNYNADDSRCASYTCE